VTLRDAVDSRAYPDARLRAVLVSVPDLTIEECAAIVLRLLDLEFAEAYRPHFASAAAKVSRAARVAQMGIATAPGPSIETAALAVCEGPR
jgi:hypothetical protein